MNKKYNKTKKIDPDEGLNTIAIKKRLKHEKNPMEICKLNKMLNNTEKNYGY